MANEGKGILNLSDKILSEPEKNLLLKGLKFCPTPGNPNIGELREDMDKLHKRLRQIAFFENPEDGPRDQPSYPELSMDNNNLYSRAPFKHHKFKLPSKGRGPPGPTALEAMIAINEHEFNNRPSFKKSYIQSGLCW